MITCTAWPTKPGCDHY